MTNAQIIKGDCQEVLKTISDNSVDLIFADPPYALQLRGTLIRPNRTVVASVRDEWDKFHSIEEYLEFSRKWLVECQRILKPTGTIWVMGSYHNIFQIGHVMMGLKYVILNDIIWHKSNPMPNFLGTRFTNATETLIWAKKNKQAKNTCFNYQLMKELNGGKQMTSVWKIPLCRGKERIMGQDGKKAHSTQKPEALLHRVILASSKEDDIVLDPFLGTGTTGAVAIELNRKFIGIEKDKDYIELALKRIQK